MLKLSFRISIITDSAAKFGFLRRFSSIPKRRFKVLDGRIDIPSGQKEQLEEQKNSYVEKYQRKYQQVMEGGGTSAILRHTQRNKKMLARDRIKHLVDGDYPMLEVGMFAGLGMEYGDICNAGLIVVIAKVSGELCIIGASDATVKGGTVFPIGVKKQLRMQEIAAQNNIPCIYIIDSGGGFLPLQSEVFPDKEQGGRAFYNEAVMNAGGIPQICMVAGSCTAGAAYIPTMANEVVMVDEIGTIFLAGPPLVYAAIGEQVSDQDLGGAVVHCEVSGCADYKASNEMEALEYTKDIMSTLNMDIYLQKSRHVEEPIFDSKDLLLLALLRDSKGRLKMRQILSRVIDGSRFHEYKPNYGKEIITGYARVSGILVGIMANDGRFSPQSCLKASNFVSICSERGIPLVFFQDIVKSLDDSSATKLIKYQAELMSYVATASVPKITFIIGKSSGVENYAMAGRSMSPNFLFLWPTSEIICDQYMTLGNDVDSTGNQSKNHNKNNPYYSSSRIWDDGVILPKDTRKILSLSLTACLTYKKRSKSEINVVRM